MTQKPSQLTMCVCYSFNGQRTYEFQWNIPIGGFFWWSLTSKAKNPSVNFVTHAWHHKSTSIPLNWLVLTLVKVYNGVRPFYYEWKIKPKKKKKKTKNDNNTHTDTNGRLNKLFCVDSFLRYPPWGTKDVNTWKCYDNMPLWVNVCFWMSFMFLLWIWLLLLMIAVFFLLDLALLMSWDILLNDYFSGTGSSACKCTRQFQK